MKSYTKFKQQLLKDKQTRRAYEDLGPEFLLVRAILHKRMERGLTQAQLARKIGTKQSAIARLESGRYNPSLALLEKVARALKTQLVVSLAP